MARSVGGKHVGIDGNGAFCVTAVPDSALKTSIDGWISGGTEWVGVKLVTFTFSNNWEVELADDDDIFDGLIVGYTKFGSSPYYYLTVEVFSVINQNSTRWTPRRVRNLPCTSGDCALQDTVITDGAAATNVEDGGTGGYGVVMAIDVPTNFADVMV